KTIDLMFGAENPRKIYNYAKFADSNEIFLSPSSWLRIFQKSLTDLRNKKVLDIDSDNVDGVDIAAGNSETRFQKKGDDWFIQKPLDVRADSNEINTFTSSIKFSKATGFAEPPVDAKSAGLDPPAFTVTVHDSKTNATSELLIGKSPEADKY